MYSPAHPTDARGYTIGDMIKSLFFILLIMSVIYSPGLLALAQTDTSSTSAPAENTVTTTTKRPFTTNPGLTKLAQTRLTNLSANMSNRMDSAVARLQNVISRLNSRLDKMSDAGLNINDARTELNLAQNKLDEAKVNLANIDTEVAAFIGSATPRETWVNLKNTYSATKTLIVASHQSILATLNLARNATATPTETETATTTPNETN